MNVTGGFGASRIDQSLLNPTSGRDRKQTSTDLNVNPGLKVDF